MQSVVLAIEPDPAQAELLRQVLAGRVSADVQFVSSMGAAIDAIGRQVPDLILVSALMSPRDEDDLVAHLRAIGNAAHLQTLTIPSLRRQVEEPVRPSSGIGSRMRKALTRRKPAAAPVGCDPAVFATQVAEYLARAQEMRARPAASVVTSEVPGSEVPASGVPDPWAYSTGSQERASYEQGAFEPAPYEQSTFESATHEERTFELAPSEQRTFEPEPRNLGTPEPRNLDEAALAIDRLIIELGVDPEAIHLAEAEAPPVLAAIPVHRRPSRMRRDDTDLLAAGVARVQAEAEATLAAEIERVRQEAAERRHEELAKLQAEAEALRESTIVEARAAAETEARGALAAELSRVRTEAEHTLTTALNQVRSEAEGLLAAEVDRVREQAEQVRLAELARVQAEADERCDAAARQARQAAEAEADERCDAAARQARQAAEAEAAKAFAEQLVRVRAEAEQTFSAELVRVRAEAEHALATQLERARVEAAEVRTAQLTEARVAAERAREMDLARAQAEAFAMRSEAAREARTAAEAAAARALEGEVARVRTETDTRLHAELERVRREAEQARVAEHSEAKLEVEKLRETAAQEAREVAEQAARRVLDSEIARVRADADMRLAAEAAALRADAEHRRGAELEEMRRQVALMQEAAAQQARAAAAEAIAAEVARATAGSRRPFAAAQGRHPQVLRVTSTAGATLRTANAEQRTTNVALRTANPEQGTATLEPATLNTNGEPGTGNQEPSDSSYYSIFREEGFTAGEVPPGRFVMPEQQSPFRHGRWTLPVAASLLLVITGGIAIDTSTFVDAATTVSARWRSAPVSAPPVSLAAATTGVAAPAKNVGTLLVETTPAGAKVVLDGKMRGRTPVTLADVPAGRHKLTIESADGVIRRTVAVRGGERTIASEAIIPGWLSVFSRIPMEISVKGRVIGTSEDGQLMLPPGRHEVTLSSDRFNFSETKLFEIQPGAVLSFTLPMPIGTVHVNATPGAEIWIEGERAGEAPLADIAVPIGTREIVIKHPSFGERREIVEVRYGTPITIDVPQS